MSRRALRALVLGVLLVACRTLPPPEPEPPGVPLPASDPRPARFVADLDALAAGREALRARTRVSLSGTLRAGFSRQLVLAARPARLRIEVLGLLGQRVAILATDGAVYDLYRAETGAVERGPVHPGILAEVAGLPLAPPVAVALLLGTPPLPPAAAGAATQAPDGGVRLRWEGAPGDAVRIAEFDAEGRLRVFALEEPPGTPRLAAGFGEYAPVAGEPFAHRVSLAFPATDGGAEVSFDRVELNPAVADHLFRLDAPRGVSSARRRARAGGGE